MEMTRMSITKKRRNVFIFDFHFLIMTKKGVEYVNETEFTRMFTTRQYLSSMQNAGFKTNFLKNGLIRDRGLYIGVKK